MQKATILGVLCLAMAHVLPAQNNGTRQTAAPSIESRAVETSIPEAQTQIRQGTAAELGANSTEKQLPSVVPSSNRKARSSQTQAGLPGTAKKDDE